MVVPLIRDQLTLAGRQLRTALSNKIFGTERDDVPWYLAVTGQLDSRTFTYCDEPNRRVWGMSSPALNFGGLVRLMSGIQQYRETGEPPSDRRHLRLLAGAHTTPQDFVDRNLFVEAACTWMSDLSGHAGHLSDLRSWRFAGDAWDDRPVHFVVDWAPPEVHPVAHAMAIARAGAIAYGVLGERLKSLSHTLPTLVASTTTCDPAPHVPTTPRQLHPLTRGQIRSVLQLFTDSANRRAIDHNSVSERLLLKAVAAHRPLNRRELAGRMPGTRPSGREGAVIDHLVDAHFLIRTEDGRYLPSPTLAHFIDVVRTAK